MRRKVVLQLVIVAAGLLSLYYLRDTNENQLPVCDDTLGCVLLKPDDPLLLGVIQDLSGNASNFGVDQVRSFEIALAERNNQLLEHSVELKIEDDRCLPEHGTVAARKLVSDPRVVAILGTTCSASAKTAGKIVSQEGYSMISGINSAPTLTSVDGKAGADWNPGFFRTMFSTDKSGEAAALFVFRNLKIRRVAVIHDGDVYTKGYATRFSRKFSSLGGEIVLETLVNKGEGKMIPVLTAVKNAGSQLIFTSVFHDEGVLLVKQLKEVHGLENLKIMGGNALISDDFIRAVGNDGIGMYFLSNDPSKSTPQLEKLVMEFRTRYGEPPRSNVFDFGYDAINVLMTAIEEIAVRDTSGNILIGRQALRDNLYQVSNYPGITGNLTADSFGDLGTPRFKIVQLKDPAHGAPGLNKNILFSISDTDLLQ